MDKNLVQQINMNELPQPILQMIVLRADDRTKARVAQTNMQWRQFVNQHFHQSAKLNLTGTQIGLQALCGRKGGAAGCGICSRANLRLLSGAFQLRWEATNLFKPNSVFTVLPFPTSIDQ
jgi:hypothetical protein